MQLLARILSWSAFLVLLLTTGGATTPSAFAASGLSFPAPSGTQWSIVAGYNTATHLAGDPYAIDLVRDDGETSGTPVLAPTDGTLSVSTNCLTVRDAARVAVLLCHVLPGPGLKSGARVARGQVIGVVAPPGQAGNNGLAHIHLAAHFNEGGRGFGTTIPLVGAYSVEDVQLPATTEANGYSGVTFRSTNVRGAAVATTTAPVVAPAPPPTAAPASSTTSGPPLAGFTPRTRALVVLTRDQATPELIESMRVAAPGSVCTISSLVAGRWVTFIDGAPATVNAPWLQAYPSSVAALTPLFAACG